MNLKKFLIIFGICLLCLGCAPTQPTAAPATEVASEVPATLAAAVPTVAPEATVATAPEVPAETACLVITGLVDKGLILSEADLRAMEVVNISAEHPKKGNQDYEGVLLNALFNQAMVQTDATKLTFTADDGYSTGIDLATVRNCKDCLVAFSDIPCKVSLVMPGMEGSAWVKNVIKIEVK